MHTLSELTSLLLTASAFLLGAFIGSFVEIAAQRSTSQESDNKRPHCDCCGHALGIRELIPFGSWLLLRGRCRYCGAKTGVRRIAAELFGGIAFAESYLQTGLSWHTLELVLLFCILLYLALVDYETMRLPNLPMLAGTLSWVCFLQTYSDPFSRFLVGLCAAVILGGGMLVLSVIMDRILKKESLGGGDIKLYALLGLVFGLKYGLLLVILSCILGLLFAAVIGVRRNGQFPLAPAIAMAALLTVMFGQPVLTWYYSLF